MDNLKGSDQSFIFNIAPEYVIFTRNTSRPSGNELLNSAPEIKLLENGIHPSVNYTVAGVEFSLMMDVVPIMADYKP